METTYRLIELIIQILNVLAWPLVILFIVIILKESLRDLIKRIRRIGNDSVGIDASANFEQTTENENPLSSLSYKSSNENIEKALGLFSQQTLDFFQNLVNKESKIDEIKKSSDREAVLFRYSQALYLVLHFNRIYSQIFGSQLDLLQALNGSNSETKDTLRVFYKNAKSQNVKFYENYSYDQYLDYLKRVNLIQEETKNKVEITHLGRDFLKYIIESGMTIEKLY